MKPSVKFGIFGGIVVLIILLSEIFILADKPTLGRTIQYLVQLAILISIVASIRQTQERSGEKTLELKTGLKAGVITASIICLFLGSFNFIYQRSIPSEELEKQSEESLSAYYVANPIKDTTTKVFNAAKVSYDSAFKNGDYRFARFMLERARLVKPEFDKDKTLVKAVNEKLIGSTTSAVNQLSKIFRLLFFQVLIGMFIAFITTMLLRYRQQQGF